MLQLIPNFIILAVAHCIADFPLQGNFLSEYKSKNNYILLVHCLIYAGFVSYVFGWLYRFYNIDYVFILLLVSHYIIDKFKCIMRDIISRDSGTKYNEETVEYIEKSSLYIDQAAHYIFIAVAMFLFG